MDLFTPVVDATKKAFDGISNIFQIERDPYLRLYKKLQYPDFQAIMDQHGLSTAAEFIQDMETRKLTRKKGGYYG